MVGFVWDTSLVFAFVSAAVLAVFSLVVGIIARFNGAAKWYAIFGISFSTFAGVGNLSEALAAWVNEHFDEFLQIPDSAFLLDLSFNIVQTAAAVVWAWATVRLMDHYGARPDRRIAVGFGALGLITGLPGTIDAAPLGGLVGALQNAWWVAVLASGLTSMVAIGIMAAAGILMARARLRESQSGQAILAAALTAYPLAWPTWTAAWAGTQGFLNGWVGLVSVAGFLALVSGWMRVRAKQGGMSPWAVVAASATFFAGSFILGITFGFRFSPSSIARTFDVILVAYAILRLQYLGLDVKVRWGLSKTTLAGIFVAAFFVGSEVAQTFFGERLGSDYVGIAAAGVLVFALAPLQRFADRVAGAAVPDAPSSADEIYTEAYRAAMRDGAVTQREERHLAVIADRLGLSATHVVNLREKAA